MITTKELVKRLAERGITRSGRTLLNDARAGRIDGPIQEHRLGYQGSQTIWFEHVEEQVVAFTQTGNGLVIDDRIIATWLRGGPVPPGFDSSEAFIANRDAAFLADMKKVSFADPKGLAGFLNDAPLSFDKSESDESEGDKIDAFHNGLESALNDSALIRRFPLLRGLAERAIHAACIAEASDDLVKEGDDLIEESDDRFTEFMGRKELAALGKIMRLIRSPLNLGTLNKAEVDDAREATFTTLLFMSTMGVVAERFERLVESEKIPDSMHRVLRLLEAIGSIPKVAIRNSPIIVGRLALFMHEDKAFARQVNALVVPLKVLSVIAFVSNVLKPEKRKALGLHTE